MKILDRFIKKENLIHDGGVHEKGNHVDVAIVFGCIVVSTVLLFLTIMTYVTL